MELTLGALVGSSIFANVISSLITAGILWMFRRHFRSNYNYPLSYSTTGLLSQA